MVLPPILNHVSLHCTFFRTKRTYGGIDQALQFWMAKMRFQPPTIQLGKLKVRLLNHLERLIELGTARVFLPLCLVGEFGHISNGFEAALAWIRHRTLHFPNQILNHNIYEDFLELYYWHTYYWLLPVISASSIICFQYLLNILNIMQLKLIQIFVDRICSSVKKLAARCV